MAHIKITKFVVFLSIIFFGLFIFCNFGNAQYLGQYTTPFGGNVIVTANVRPDIDASFPGGLSIFSPYEAAILGYDPDFHPITQLGLAMQNLGLSLPGYGYGPPYGGYGGLGYSGWGSSIYGGYSGYGGYGSPYMRYPPPIYGPTYALSNNDLITPYVIPGVGGGVSGVDLYASWQYMQNASSLGYDSPYGGLGYSGWGGPSYGGYGPGWEYSGWWLR